MAAGLAGVAVMTAAEKLEQALTRRPDSQVPGRVLGRVLRLGGTDRPGLQRRMWAMHVGMAVGVGAVRGVMAFAGLRGPWASSMFTVVRLTADQVVENWTGVGAPPWTWPRDELAVDLAGKAVYAFVTGAVADRLAAAAGVSPVSATPSWPAGAGCTTSARSRAGGCARAPHERAPRGVPGLRRRRQTT
jgi:hypothetical protein